MDIFEGDPSGKFFEISFAEGPVSVRNETGQALIARERTCEARGISEEGPRCFIAQNRALQDGLNDEFCR